MSKFKCGNCGTELEGVFLQVNHVCPDIKVAVAAARAEARREALEEAAKIADNTMPDCDQADYHVGCHGGIIAASAIRALIQKEAQEGGPK